MDDNSLLDTLGLSAWPFDVVPDMRAELSWADRSGLRRDIERLLRRLRGHSSNTIHLLWADFGAGKTHTLLFIRQLTDESDSVVGIYSVLPRGIKNFVDIYRSVVRGVRPTAIGEAFEKARAIVGRGTVESEIRSLFPAMLPALRAIEIGGDAQRELAYAWLLAEPNLTKRDLDGISLTSRIRTADDAVYALAALVHLFHLAGHPRVIVMIDEFQRVQELRGGVRDEINAGLHTFFNTCPPALSMLLCFSFGAEGHIRAFLNEELISRVDPIRLSIPTLSVEDALEFVQDLWKRVLLPNKPPPMDVSTTTLVVQRISDHAPITPRRLMKAMGLVLSEGAIDLQDGQIEVIDESYADELLTDAVVTQIVDEKEE